MGERTGSRVFHWVWSYVLNLFVGLAYKPILTLRLRLIITFRFDLSNLENIPFVAKLSSQCTRSTT
ncbi:hypothetical protein B0T20DRAFT_56800 [Sordaria brevicollis]|uniref:Uncharacterized protein n=1 Tax=Sordaria brevicollis TaxID=83679 RepID=A0AAE0P300_SORBR|nr:hypothetical protein B0T20DRAFT_56800 [Sordaria brevicollis]